MKTAVTTLIVVTGMILAYDIGLETGIRNKPVFDATQMQEEQCGDVERTEYGLKCVIHLQQEGNNVRIFRERSV